MVTRFVDSSLSLRETVDRDYIFLRLGGIPIRTQEMPHSIHLNSNSND
jgi:hypothetical protein